MGELLNRPAVTKSATARDWRGRLLLAATSVVCLALLGEIACRFAGYRSLEVYIPDRELGWILAPNQKTVTKVGHLTVTTNEDGFRDDPLEQPRRPTTVRIFALGNSTTFGWGVGQRDVYAELLERMLNDSASAAGVPTHYEIVNAGVNAYNLWQMFASMRRITRRHDADGFLMAYVFNDSWNRVGALTMAQRERLLAGVRMKNLLRKSALYNWLVEVRARWLYDRLRQWAGAGTTAHTGSNVATAAELAAYRQVLDSILDFAEKAKIWLAFTILAANGQGDAWPRQFVMAQVGASRRIPVLDLVPIMGRTRHDSLFLRDDAVHLSPLGHTLVAHLIYSQLCSAARTATATEPAALFQAGCRAATR